MSFMNKKEDVLDIQLTQHGKRLLADGEFNPVYYAFFDNDVIYDGERAGFVETQNETNGRIQTDTARLKAQHIFYDPERELNATFKLSDGTWTPPVFEKHFIDGCEIGTCDLSTEAKPAWNIQFLHGEVSSSVAYMTGSHQTLRIPQLSSSVIYNTYISEDDTKPTGEDAQLSPTIFSDGTYISIVPEHLLVDITENNVEYKTTNFDIEVFLIEEENISSLHTPGVDPSLETKREILRPLVFVPISNNIINDILINEQIPDIELTSQYVEYFFNLYTDFEIDKEILCDGVQELKAKGIMIDSELVDCPEKKSIIRMNPYYSTVSDTDVENCESE